MMDKRVILYGDAGNSARVKTYKWKFIGKRLPNKNWEFNATNTPNHMYFMLILSEKVSVPYPAFTFNARLTYTDA